MDKESLYAKSVDELRQLARDNKWKGYSDLRKADLVDFILEKNKLNPISPKIKIVTIPVPKIAKLTRITPIRTVNSIRAASPTKATSPVETTTREASPIKTTSPVETTTRAASPIKATSPVETTTRAAGQIKATSPVETTGPIRPKIKPLIKPIAKKSIDTPSQPPGLQPPGLQPIKSQTLIKPASPGSVKKPTIVPLANKIVPHFEAPEVLKTGLQQTSVVQAMTFVKLVSPYAKPAKPGKRPQMSREKRILMEIKEISEDPPVGVMYIPSDDDISTGVLMIQGQDDCPYQGGFFKILITFPEMYPSFPPIAHFVSPTNFDRMHPNFYPEGKICLSILGTWQGPGWESDMTISYLATSMQLLLGKYPYAYSPMYGGEGEKPFFTSVKAEEEAKSSLNIALFNTLKYVVWISKHLPPEADEMFSLIVEENKDYYRARIKKIVEMSKQKELPNVLIEMYSPKIDDMNVLLATQRGLETVIKKYGN